MAVNLIAIFWLLLLIIGWPLYAWTRVDANTFYDLGGWSRDYIHGGLAILLASIFLYFGGVIARKTSGSGTFSLKRDIKPLQAVLAETAAGLPLWSILLLYILGFYFAIQQYTFYGIFIRDYYLAEVGVEGVFLQMVIVLGVATSLLLIYDKRYAAGLIFSLLFFLLAVTKGTRLAAVPVLMVPSVYYISLLKTTRDSVVSKSIYLLSTLVVLVLSALLLQVLIGMRDFNSYGIIPFFGYIFSVMIGDIFIGEWSVYEVLLNLSFGLTVTDITISDFTHSWYDIIVALNPLPGASAGWDDLLEVRRINIYVPFSSFGELYGFSPVLLCCYMLVAGYFIGYNEIRISQKKRFIIFRFAIFLLLCMLFALLSPQYNLRSVTRLLWYMLVLFSILNLFERFFSKKI